MLMLGLELICSPVLDFKYDQLTYKLWLIKYELMQDLAVQLQLILCQSLSFIIMGIFLLIQQVYLFSLSLQSYQEVILMFML